MKNNVLWACVIAGCVSGGVSQAGGGLLARVSESGESVELSQQVDGKMLQYSLPLYREGTVRYFSAGVGLEERSAQYPPFPLKLVFTAGGKPYLAGVSVAIQPVKGGAGVTIPEDRVEGPWLFVDLAPGHYNVTAVYGGAQQRLKDITVEAGRQKTLQLRWTEDRGLSRPLPGE